jgi:dTDP-4-dehydrorhamnose reductase
MKRLLVTGASGFLGWNVCRAAARAGWDVYGAYHSHPLSLDNAKTVSLDLNDPEAVWRTMASVRPDAVIHCAAQPDPNVCEAQPDQSHRINVQASVTLAAACRRQGALLAYVSTDLVFDGEHAPYAESDAQGPVNVYGQHKAEAERGMRTAYPGVTICRVPVMFGDAGPCSKSFIQPQIAALLRGEAVKYFSDEIRTPVSGATAALGLLLCLDKPAETFHLGGRRRVSRWDFGLLLCAAIGAPRSLAAAVSQKDITGPRAPRPRDVSLVSDKAYALGYDPKPLDEQLGELQCVRPAPQPPLAPK